ncbi:caspase family protein [Roseofilum sp. Belize Diploria]|uniref:nSTAND1 domain-containing NTPase n=1 Tax=Roseofilum sp. Belize Diploria TaxID=2821501 RepID=UPI001AFD2FCE|nr:caspase family protein [Roseofilum sp. Belize Diploria]MBP0009414.1 caspase family protein [Roseofilum sp. Belize Diploria]
MSRDALVVGISTYSYRGLSNLDAPAHDAEAIAQKLESGLAPFRVERLPGIKDKANEGLKTGKKTQVSLRQLQTALIRYFKPRGETYADTVLFYYSGHGLYDKLTETSYLATSDADPEANKWGYPLEQLCKLLRDSPVKRQIIWLDCCHSGGIVAVNEANPGQQGGYSRCFVAASQEIELAYELASRSHGVLTDALLRGLNCGEWIDTLSLSAFVNRYLKNERKTYPQRPLFLNTGEPIDLIPRENGGKTEELPELQPNLRPYRALNAFDRTEEDVKVFFGRRTLTDELLGQICDRPFLAVLGPSGSGKSSVVQAGLLYEIEQGKRRSGTEDWQILGIIKPGDSPLRSLAGIFLEGVKSQTIREKVLNDLQERGSTALRELIEGEECEQTLVLVVDQFEEIFSLCRGSEEKERERKDFLNCLFETVDVLEGQLRLVITLRADFLGKCLEQSDGNLAERIKANRVDMTPLTEAELEEAIAKPAATVGLRVAADLRERLKADIRAAPGSLPLLQYALYELWQDWRKSYGEGNASDELTLAGYTRIGEVAGALEKQANAVYESFAESSIEQGLVRRIFLELVQLGDETEDTRRRVLKQELVSDIHPKTMVDEVLDKLAKSRLIVMDENDSSAVVIDLAHEATIRHWQQLRSWLNQHRQDLPLIRQLRTEAATWEHKGRQSKYLLVGARLDNALDCADKYRKLGYLSETVQAFIRVSRETQIADETEKEKQILEALCMTAEVQWSRHQQLESLITIAKAGKRLQEIRQTRPEVEPDNSSKAIAILRQILTERIQEKNRLEAHQGRVNAVAYSPDGQTLASVSRDGTVKLWHVEDGTLLHTLEAHQSSVLAVAYSPDVQTLASASRDRTVKLWHVEDGTLLHTLEAHQGSVNAVAYSPDGKTLASASGDNTIKFWQVEDGALLYTLAAHQDWVRAVAYSPNGQTLASASGDNTIKFWQVDNGTLLHSLEAHHGWVNALAYSPDGQTLASASDDNSIKLWRVDNGTLLHSLEAHHGSVLAVAYSPDGQTLASASRDRTVKLWHVEDGTLLHSLEAHQSSVLAVAYSPDGQTLASASDDNSIKLWRVRKSCLLQSLQAHKGSVLAVAYSPDSQTLASSSDDNTIKLWKIEDGSLLHSLGGHQHWIWAVAYSPDGQTLASVSRDGTVKLWHVEDGTLLHSLAAHQSSVLAVAYSPDGQTLASASRDGIVILWHVEDGTLLHSPVHQSSVLAVAYSPDGQTLTSASSNGIVMLWHVEDGTVKLWHVEDGTVKLWHVEDGTFLYLKAYQDVVNAVAYSPDGKTLASASRDGTVKLLRVDNGTLLHSLEAHQGVVNAVAYSPNGKTLASASRNGTIKLWNVEQGTLLHSLETHQSGVNAVVYSPDGQTIASANSDGTVKLWDAGGNLDTLMIRACDWLRDYLTHNPNVNPSDRKLLE